MLYINFYNTLTVTGKIGHTCESNEGTFSHY